MTGFEVFRYYLGVKLHFSSETYDVVESGGHVRVGQTAYMKRRDRMIFENLAGKFEQPREVIKYLVANFAYGHNNVLYDREVGQEMLVRWIKNKESLSRVFATDLESTNLYTNDAVLRLMKSGRINIESVCLMVQFDPKLIEKWESKPENKLLYESDLLRIRKLVSFIKITDNCRKVWNDYKSELNCTEKA